MKQWPDKNKAANFNELSEPICKAIRFAYQLTRQNEGVSIPWKGLTIGERELATCFQPDERLSKEQLEYDDENQGRDALDVLVGLAIQLGIEQGRRMTTRECLPDPELCVMLARQVIRVFGESEKQDKERT